MKAIYKKLRFFYTLLLPFSLLYAQEKTLQPFAQVTIPLLKNITVTDAEEKTENGETYYEGKAVILNSPVEITVKTITNEENQKGVLVTATLPETWKLSDSIPALKNIFPFNKLTLKEAKLIATSINYKDPETKRLFLAGLNISAKAPLIDPLDRLSKLLGSEGEISLYGPIDTNIRKIKLEAELTGSFKTKSGNVSTGPLTLEITGEPSFGLFGDITIQPSKKDQPITFAGGIELSLEEAVIKIQLEKWENPFGIKSFTLKKITGEVGISYEIFPETGLPSSFALGGELDVADKKVIMATKIDIEEPENIALLGKLEGSLSLIDIIRAFANPMGTKIPITTIPNISIENAEVRFAPTNVIIGPPTGEQLIINQGLTLKGALTVMQKQALVDFTVDITGIKSLGCMSKIDLGALHIATFTNPTIATNCPKVITRPKECAKTQDGPFVDIELNTSNQLISLLGLVQLEGIFSTGSCLSISQKGITFDFETDIAKGMFDAHVTGQSSGTIDNPDFRLIIDFKDKFISFIQQRLNTALKQAEGQIQSSLNNALAKVNSLAGLQQQVADAQQKVAAAQNKVNGLQGQIDSLKNWYYNLPRISFTSKSQTSESISFGAQMGALELAYNTAKGALSTAQAFLNQVAAPLSDAAFQAAKSLLEKAQTAGIAALEAGQWVIKDISQAITINKAKFDGDLKTITAGKLPGVIFDIVALGKATQHIFPFDFTNPDASTQAIVSGLVDSLKILL